MPPSTTVAEIVRDLGVVLEDDRQARLIEEPETEEILALLRRRTVPVKPASLGELGVAAFAPTSGYAIERGTTLYGDACIPFVVEAWIECTKTHNTTGAVEVEFELWLNRSPSLALITGHSAKSGIVVRCGGFGGGSRVPSPRITTLGSVF